MSKPNVTGNFYYSTAINYHVKFCGTYISGEQGLCELALAFSQSGPGLDSGPPVSYVGWVYCWFSGFSSSWKSNRWFPVSNSIRIENAHENQLWLMDSYVNNNFNLQLLPRRCIRLEDKFLDSNAFPAYLLTYRPVAPSVLRAVTLGEEPEEANTLALQEVGIILGLQHFQ